MNHLTLIVLFALAALSGCTSPAQKPANASPGCEPGTTFTGDDGCSKCFCGDDGVACSAVSCGGSSDAGGDAGASGCDDGGTFRAPGESFVGADGCSSCFCGDDGIVCSAVGCANNDMCPPCEPPPSSDCVGSGPCGCGPYTCPDAGSDAGSDAGRVIGDTCADTTCGPGELCMQLPGCPVGMENPPVCVPIPSACEGDPSCGCFDADPCGGSCTTCTAVVDGQIMCDCLCICASPDTPIATPSGARPIAELLAGDLVYSVDHDAVVPVPLVRVGKQRVVNHRVLHIEFDDGATFEISPGHPTADGRLLADLRAGDVLDGRTVLRVEFVRYHHDYTYDILPASSTGAYYAAGVLIGSTLAAAREPVAVANEGGARIIVK